MTEHALLSSWLGLDHALLCFALAVACPAVRTVAQVRKLSLLNCAVRSIRRPTNSYSVHQASDSEDDVEEEESLSEDEEPALAFSRAGRSTSM